MREKRPAGKATAPAVWLAHTPDRSGKHPMQHLAQADAYAGFNRLYDSGDVKDAASSAQVRRKFFDIERAHVSRLAGEALKRIDIVENDIQDVRRMSKASSPGPVGSSDHRPA